jgi:hypothetical protein
LASVNKITVQKFFSEVNNEKGSAIVLALIVLAAITIIGVASSNFSVTELFVARNDTVKKISFFNADAGIFATPKVISRSINNKETPAEFSPPFSYVDAGNDTTIGDRTFYRELAGLEDHDDAADISFQNDGVNTTSIDVTRLGSFSMIGGGAEFASGAEGHGAGYKGVRFNLLSAGTGQNNALTSIQARYLKVLGAAGGL